MPVKTVLIALGFVLAPALAAPSPLADGSVPNDARLWADSAHARDGCGSGRYYARGRCRTILKRGRTGFVVGPQSDAPRYPQAHHDWCIRHHSAYNQRDNTYAWDRDGNRRFCQSPYGGP